MAKRSFSRRSNLNVLAIGFLTPALLSATLTAAHAVEIADAARQDDRTAVSTLIHQKVDVNAALNDGTTALHWAAANDDRALVDQLIQAGANPKTTTRVGGITPLSIACVNGDPVIVTALLKAGADPNAASDNGTTPLMTAAGSGDIATVNALIDHGANVNAKESIHGQTALMFAAAADRDEVIRVLINRGADWKISSTVSPLGRQATDDDDDPPPARPTGGGRVGRGGAAGGARAASADGDPADADGAGIGGAVAPAGGAATDGAATGGRGAGAAGGRRRRGAGGATGAAGAAANGAGAAPGRAAAGADPDAAAAFGGFGGFGGGAPKRTFGGNTALQFAAREGHLDAVKALVEFHVDVNEPNAGDKTTPLVTAICNGHYDVANYLLDHGADPNQASVDGLEALYAVIDTQWAPVGWAPNPITDQEKISYLELMKALIDHKADVNAKLTRRLWFRPTHHNEGWVNPAGATAFWRAAQATDIAAMRLLVASGADTKVVNGENINALGVAAGLGYNGNFSVQGPDSAIETVRYCLKLGLDLNLVSKQGYTALGGAAYRGDTDLVELLVGLGADLNQRTSRGWSITDMANGPSLRTSVPVKHPETVAVLLTLGSPPLTKYDDQEEILGIIRRRPAAPAAPAPAATTAAPASVP